MLTVICSDPPVLVLWAVAIVAGIMYPLGMMLGSPCSPCCGGGECRCGFAVPSGAQLPAGKWCCGADAEQQVTVRVSFPRPIIKMWPDGVDENNESTDIFQYTNLETYRACAKKVSKYMVGDVRVGNTKSLSRMDCTTLAGDYVLQFARVDRGQWQECTYGYSGPVYDARYPTCARPQMKISIAAADAITNSFFTGDQWGLVLTAEFVAQGRQWITAITSISSPGGDGTFRNYWVVGMPMVCTARFAVLSSTLNTGTPCPVRGMESTVSFIPNGTCCPYDGCGEDFGIPYVPGALCSAATGIYTSEGREVVLDFASVQGGTHPSWEHQAEVNFQVLP